MQVRGLGVLHPPSSMAISNVPTTVHHLVLAQSTSALCAVRMRCALSLLRAIPVLIRTMKSSCTISPHSAIDDILDSGWPASKLHIGLPLSHFTFASSFVLMNSQVPDLPRATRDNGYSSLAHAPIAASFAELMSLMCMLDLPRTGRIHLEQ